MFNQFADGFRTIESVLDGLYDLLKWIEPKLPEMKDGAYGVVAGGIILDDLVEGNFIYVPLAGRYYCTRNARDLFNLCEEALNARGWHSSHMDNEPCA